MAMQLGAVGPAMFGNMPGQLVHGAGGGNQSDPSAEMIATLVKTILSEMQAAEEKSRAALKADEAETRARGASGVGGLLDSQRAGLAAIRDPNRRATALGSMTHVNRGRILKTAGIPETAPYVTAMKNDETEAEYVQRMQTAKASHEARQRQVRDKLRGQTQADRAYKAQTGKRGTGYVITADEREVSDPLNPGARPRKQTSFSQTSMVERPLSRPPMKRDSFSSVEFPGHGSGAPMVTERGFPSVGQARQAAGSAIETMGGSDPLNPAERTKVLNGPTDEEKLKQTLMQALLSGAF